MIMKKILVALLTVLLFNTGALAEEYGDDWDWDPYAPAIVEMTIAHGADLVSTVVALSVVEGVIESNPLGIGLVAAKVVLSYGLIPLFNEEDQATLGHVISDVTYGAVVNNLLVIAGATGAVPIVGLVVTSAYLLMCDFEVLPEYMCIVGYETIN